MATTVETKKVVTPRVVKRGNRTIVRGGNAGKNGRPEWAPAPARIRKGGTIVVETQEDAWERARNWVRMAAVTGMQQEVMCELLTPPCSVETLRKHFRMELDYGKDQVTQLIASKLVQDALMGNDRNQRFYLETQAGWTRKVEGNLTGAILVRAIAGDEDE